MKTRKISPSVSVVAGIIVLGLSAHAATVDTTGTTQVINDHNPGNKYIGNGVLSIQPNGIGLIDLGTTASVVQTEFAMTSGGQINIVSGVTLRNGGNNKGVWTNNLAGLNIASTGSIDMWDGNPVIVDALTGAGSVDIATTFGLNWAGNRSLVLGVNNGSGTFSGTIAGNAATDGATLGLTKNGSGTQTLLGATTYGGGTTVNGGRLVLTDSKSGSSNFVTNAELEFKVTTGYQQFDGGAFSGTGSIIKSGAGLMAVGAQFSPQSVALTGAGSIIDVQGGAIRNEYGNSAWTGNKAGVNVANGAFFDVWDGDTTVDELTGAGTVNKGWEGDITLTIGVNNGSGTFSGVIENNNPNHFYGGAVGGDLSLVKGGTGTQTLSGANTYAGETTINGGTLEAAAADALGATSEVTINASGSLLLSGSSERVNNTAVVNLNGGTLAFTNALSGTAETLGTLVLSASSIIDFGTADGKQLLFAGLGAHTPGSSVLNLLNWSGTVFALGNANTDRLIFTGAVSDFTTKFGQSDVSFGGFASGYQAISFNGGTQYEIVPVPEPSAWVSVMALLAVIGYRERKWVVRMRDIR